jgi:hypothetical protein
MLCPLQISSSKYSKLGMVKDDARQFYMPISSFRQGCIVRQAFVYLAPCRDWFPAENNTTSLQVSPEPLDTPPPGRE